ncbi:MAG: AraC family transcriptional regulator [Methanobrevibacter sp.]|nr:AraC family transcriptional regulator [Methanobrevibacter sp.]MEA4957517.1 AraC family transcriptional regulator [Methanobrevibacter sp.]
MKKNPLKINIDKKYENSMKIFNENSFKTVYSFDFKLAKGKMISYGVFPGIYLINIEIHGFEINEFNRMNSNQEITINHCKKGRFECKFKGKYHYLEEGDLVVSTKNTESNYSTFPLGYYEGIEIYINKKSAKPFLKDVFGYSFDLNELYNKISENNDFLLIKSTKEIEHIFNEMYYVDEKIQKIYFKLKVLELFLFLKITPLNNTIENRKYFSKKQVETIKTIRKELIENIQKPITLEYLSKKYNISITSLKTSFKSIYGKPVYTWRKEYRLQVAKELLNKEDYKISYIANKVGYKNSSKFSAAFKDYYKITPSQYRLKENKRKL